MRKARGLFALCQLGGIRGQTGRFSSIMAWQLRCGKKRRGTFLPLIFLVCFVLAGLAAPRGRCGKAPARNHKKYLVRARKLPVFRHIHFLALASNWLSASRPVTKLGKTGGSRDVFIHSTVIAWQPRCLTRCGMPLAVRHPAREHPHSPYFRA